MIVFDYKTKSTKGRITRKIIRTLIDILYQTDKKMTDYNMVLEEGTTIHYNL